MISDHSFGAVILAAGRSSRMKGTINKIYMDIGEQPVLLYSLDKFLEFSAVEECLLVIKPEDRSLLESRILPQLNASRQVQVVEGGEKRQDSSWAGVRQVSSEYVFVHDAARPNFSRSLLDRLGKAALKHGAAIPGLQPVDTIRESDKGWAGQTLDREKLIRAQTPQCFRASPLREALRRAEDSSRYFTDDAGVLTAMNDGAKCKIVAGERYNLKLTTKEDFTPLGACLTDSPNYGN